MTIGLLCREYHTTMNQFTILMRADVIFAGNRCGRYYGGPLTEPEVAFLVEGLRKD